MDGRYSHSPQFWRSTVTRIDHIGSGISIGHSLINWRSVQLSIGWWRRGKMNVMVMSRGRKSRVRHVLLPIDWLRVDGWLTPGAIVHWTWSRWIITSVLGNLRLYYIKQYIITFIGYRKEKKNANQKNLLIIWLLRWASWDCDMGCVMFPVFSSIHGLKSPWATFRW